MKSNKTVEEVIAAKKVAESEISKIIGKFAVEFDIDEMDIKFNTKKAMAEGQSDPISTQYLVELKVSL